MVLYIVIGVAVLIGLWAILTYNGLVARRAMVAEGWSGIDAQLKRRADLIPNLVSTVQGYANQERAVLTQVTEARAKATQVKVDASTLTDPAAFEKYQQAQNQLSGVLGRLLSISENYPDLKSNANFLALQSQLEGTENRINVARRDYNESVRVYNTTLRTFPGMLWASTVYRNEKPMPLFAASEAAQTAPTVNFNISPGGSSTTTTTTNTTSSTTGAAPGRP